MTIMLQRWLTRVCEDLILIREGELRLLVENDFSSQPTQTCTSRR